MGLRLSFNRSISTHDGIGSRARRGDRPSPIGDQNDAVASLDRRGLLALRAFHARDKPRLPAVLSLVGPPEDISDRIDTVGLTNSAAVLCAIGARGLGGS